MILCTQGKLVAWDPMCQWCQTLSHECYGLSDKVCGQCQHDKKTYQDVIVKGKLCPLLVMFPDLKDNSRSSSCCPSLGPPYGGPNKACDPAKEGCSQG